MIASMRLVGDTPKCILLVEGQHFYVTLCVCVYIYTSRGFNDFHVESLFTLVIFGFYAQTEDFYARTWRCVNKTHARFLRSVPPCINTYTL
jgi:hypothetical protein